MRYKNCISPSILIILFLSFLGAPSSAYADTCHASKYPGENGGEKIQRAIDDAVCGTVLIDVKGPDNGQWLVTQPILLRANKTVASASQSRRPVILAAKAGAWALFRIINQSGIVLRRLDLKGNGLAKTGVEVDGASEIQFHANLIERMTLVGIHLTNRPSTRVEIKSNTFDNNNYIDVRTDTAKRDTFHTAIAVQDNVFTGTQYGIALANCGGNPKSRCVVKGNRVQTRLVSEYGNSSGIDLNRSHFAYVNGNKVMGNRSHCSPSQRSLICRCLRGITLDDNRNSEVSRNSVSGCLDSGIMLANGAVPSNSPWWSTGNVIEYNTVSDNVNYGLYSSRDPANPDDHNEWNIWRFNSIKGNKISGCVNYSPGPAGRNAFYRNSSQTCWPQIKSE